LLDAVAADTDIRVVEVDGRVAVAGDQADLVAEPEPVGGGRDGDASVLVRGALVGRGGLVADERRARIEGRRLKAGVDDGTVLGRAAHHRRPHEKARLEGLGRRAVAVQGVRDERELRRDPVWSRADSPDTARIDRVESGEDRWHEWPQILDAVGSGTNEHNAKRQCREALLELDAAIHCDEDVILTGHSTEQFAVFDPSPAATGDSVYRMTMKFRRKAYW
jgi:hypothetical protein